jgi:hypothetical protein
MKRSIKVVFLARRVPSYEVYHGSGLNLSKTLQIYISGAESAYLGKSIPTSDCSFGGMVVKGSKNNAIAFLVHSIIFTTNTADLLLSGNPTYRRDIRPLVEFPNSEGPFHFWRNLVKYQSKYRWNA